MKEFKKLILAAVITALGFGLFAQSSKTDTATNNLFKTDVDKFMNVNEWSAINPEHAFLYFGMPGAGSYSLGFAKDIKGTYWGTYFSGQFGTLSIVDNDDTKTKTTTDGNTYFTFNNLFGFGNMGLLVTFDYRANNSTKTDVDGDKTYTDSKNYKIGAVLGLGDKEFKGKNLKPYIGLSYNMNPDNASKSDNGTTETDTRDWRLDIWGGADIELSKKENLSQNLLAEVKFYTQNPVDTDNHKNKTTEIAVPLTYKAIINASDKLAFGVKANLNPRVQFGEDNNEWDVFNFYATPAIAAGVTFDTQKKVIFNGGVKFAVPGFSYTKPYNNTEKQSRAYWNGTDGALTYTSGLTVTPVKNLTIDCSWNMLQNLFNNTSSNLSEGNTNFWNTVNKVLVHNVTFEVSYKF